MAQMAPWVYWPPFSPPAGRLDITGMAWSRRRAGSAWVNDGFVMHHQAVVEGPHGRHGFILRAPSTAQAWAMQSIWHSKLFTEPMGLPDRYRPGGTIGRPPLFSVAMTIWSGSTGSVSPGPHRPAGHRRQKLLNCLVRNQASQTLSPYPRPPPYSCVVPVAAANQRQEWAKDNSSVHRTHAMDIETAVSLDWQARYNAPLLGA